jgi:hypothetical protein
MRRLKRYAAMLGGATRPESLGAGLALLISVLGSPFATPLYTAMVIVWTLAESRGQFMVWGGLIFIFFVGIAFSFVVIQVLRGKISDLHVSEQSQRHGPFAVAVCSSVVGSLGLWWLGGPWTLVALGSSFAMQGIIFGLLTRCDKISMHVAVTASCMTALVLLFGWVVVPLVVLLPALGWARMRRGRHTLAQVMAGALLAPPLTLMTLIPWWAFGLIG